MDEKRLESMLAETRKAGSDMSFGMHYAVMVPLSLMVNKGLITVEEAIERAKHFEHMLKAGPRPSASIPLEMLISTLQIEQKRRDPDQKPSNSWEPRIVEGGPAPQDSDDTPK